MSDQNPISAPLRDLLSVFADELAELRFGDVDADLLEKAAALVQAAAAQRAKAETALEEAQTQLSLSRQAFADLGVRALAYARIFAENQPQLRARLDAIELPSGSTPATKDMKVDGRRRRHKEASESLPTLLLTNPG